MQEPSDVQPHGAPRGPQRLAGFAIGLAATLWFVVRVAQKPSRATYPCMRASFPIMSAFLAYLVALAGAAASVHLMRRERILPRPRSAAFGALLAALVWTTVATPQCGEDPICTRPPAGTVLGQGQGLFPGRVVWVHDPRATNESCTNRPGDGYFLPQNNDQATIDRMVVDALQHLTETDTVPAACDALFTHYNETHGRGRRGHRVGETVFLKTNATSSWDFGQPWGNIRSDFRIQENAYYGVAETTPQVVLAMLRVLVNRCGLGQPDIAVGDPMKDIYEHAMAYWRDEFPNVTYLSAHGGGGRTATRPSSQPLVFYSDRGSVLRTGEWWNPSAGEPVTADYLYAIYERTDYIVNIGALKGHNRGGVTLCAKNHFGSQTRGSALHLHMGLVNPAGQDNAVVRPDRQGYGLYRVLVDLMGHRLLGGKTMLYMIVGLWGGSEAVDPPVRFSSPPFDGDWSSSILVSQDPVAIESVGLDILASELTEARHPDKAFPQMSGVDDYLHQAADPTSWPQGIVYDPENDGTPITSLGVHEHWAGPDDQRYGRNLGRCEGIELLYYGPDQ